MKKIAIVYKKGSKNTICSLPPVQCQALLTDAGYRADLCPIEDRTSFYQYLREWTGARTDLLLTYGLAGLAYRTTGGNPAYNLIPQNILHFVKDLMQTDHHTLEGLHNLTTAVLTANEKDKAYIERHYPGICKVVQIGTLEKDLIPLLARLDWRENTTASIHTI